MMNKIVTNLGCDHHLVPLVWECLRNQLFAQSVAVRVGCIEERDAEIERLVHERDRFAFGKIPPPPSGNRPQTKADLADRQVGVLVIPKAHTTIFTAEGMEVTERI